jgi:hypothetical protein
MTAINGSGIYVSVGIAANKKGKGKATPITGCGSP